MTPTPAILGIGTALPSGRLSQADAVAAASDSCCSKPEHKRLLPVLYRKTQVAHRGSVLVNGDGDGDASASFKSFFPARTDLRDMGPSTRDRMIRYSEEAPALAFEASLVALTDSGVRAEEITHLVTVSCTGFEAPGFDIALIESLRLSPDVSRTHIGFMGCHGALNGLRVAAAFARTSPHARVLLCAVELCSLHFHYGWEPDKIVANALFGDGAGAVIVGPGSTNHLSMTGWRVAANGSHLFPDSQDAMNWRIGNHGFIMTLSPKVPDLISLHLRPWIERWLATQNLSLSDIKTWAIHPGGPRILDAVVQSLSLDPAAAQVSRDIMARSGNMSSPTLLFIIQQLRESNAPGPCVAIGFGPGLAAETTLFT